MEDKPTVTYCSLEKIFSITQDDQTVQIHIVSQEEYNSLIDAKFSWFREQNVLSIDNQGVYPDSLKTIYLDTHWEAITSESSKYSILATGYVQNCVAFILINENSRKIGLYHIYPNDQNERIEHYVLKFMEGEDAGGVRSVLMSGRISDNLSRCYEIIKKKDIQSLSFHVLEVVEEGNKLTPSPTMTSDNQNFESDCHVLSFLNNASVNASVDSSTMEICLLSEMQVEKLVSAIREIHGDILQRATDAIHNGIHVKGTTNFEKFQYQ